MAPGPGPGMWILNKLQGQLLLWDCPACKVGLVGTRAKVCPEPQPLLVSWDESPSPYVGLRSSVGQSLETAAPVGMACSVPQPSLLQSSLSVRQNIKCPVQNHGQLLPFPPGPFLPCTRCTSGPRFSLPGRTSSGGRRTSLARTLKAGGRLPRPLAQLLPVFPPHGIMKVPVCRARATVRGLLLCAPTLTQRPC